MTKRSLTFFDRMQMHLYDDDTDISPERIFTKAELEVRRRYMIVFSYWCEKPTLSDKKIVQFIADNFSLSKMQAYRDLHDIKLLLGNVRNAAKEWQRFKLIAMLDKAYEIAETRKNAAAMIMAADKLGKYTNLDKEDAVRIPYDEIVPQSFEPTEDVTVLGMQRIPDLARRQKRLREKYGSTLVEETSFEMLEDGKETE